MDNNTILIILVIALVFWLLCSGSNEPYHVGYNGQYGQQYLRTHHGVHRRGECHNICQRTHDCHSSHYDPSSSQCHLYSDNDSQMSTISIVPNHWDQSWHNRWGRRHYGGRWHHGRWWNGGWQTRPWPHHRRRRWTWGN